MIAPRKYVHLLLIISELINIGIALYMIIIYINTDWYHKIWMGSKILTLKKLMNIWNKEIYPITSIDDEGNKTTYCQNYETLLKHSGTNCKANYKKCGILDTMGNIMCIPETDECPINEMIENQATNVYSSLGYHEGRLNMTRLGRVLYYSNAETNNSIIARIIKSEKPPIIINEFNLIFDNETYNDSLTPTSDGSYDGGYDFGCGDYGGGGDWGGGGDIGGGSGGFIKRRKLEEEEEDDRWGNAEYTKYIWERFEDEINLDKSFKNISNETYVGHYLGFKDYSNLEKYSNLDLYNLYFIVFPNKAAYIFCYFLIVIFIGLIIFSLTRFLHKDVPNEGFDPCAVLMGKLYIIIPYLIFYIGYFIYIVYEYDNIYNKLRHEELLEIKADPFFEDLLQEIYDRNPNSNIVLIFISLYVLSMLLYITAMIINHRFHRKIYSFLQETKVTTNTELTLSLEEENQFLEEKFLIFEKTDVMAFYQGILICIILNLF